MNLAINSEDILSKLNQTLSLTSQQKETSYRQTIRSYYYKSFGCFQIIEICLLILILFEHTFIFILTFKKNSSKPNPK